MSERYPLERLNGPHFRGVPFTNAASGPGQFAGRTAVASGVTTATVSTSLVQSDSLILALAATSVASNVAQVIKVNTINPGNHFIFGVNPAPVGTDYNIMWFMIRS